MTRLFSLVAVLATLFACGPDTTSTSTPTTNAASTSGTSTASTEPGSTSGDSTGVILCGNGVLDEGEECELGDAYCDDCIRGRLVFVSGQGRASAGADLKGTLGADRTCDLIARTYGLDGPDGDRRFRAWLSDASSSVVDRFSPAPGRYVCRDGIEVAASWSQLLSGELTTAPRLNAAGEDEFDTPVWTATSIDGTYDGKGDCSGWGSTDGTATWGVSSTNDSGWTDFGTAACDMEMALYCFEQPVESVCSLTPCKTDADCPFGTVCFPAVDGIGTLICGQPCKTDAGCHLDCGGPSGSQPQVRCAENYLCEPVLCEMTTRGCDCRAWLGGQKVCY